MLGQLLLGLLLLGLLLGLRLLLLLLGLNLTLLLHHMLFQQVLLLTPLNFSLTHLLPLLYVLRCRLDARCRFTLLRRLLELMKLLLSLLRLLLPNNAPQWLRWDLCGTYTLLGKGQVCCTKVGLGLHVVWLQSPPLNLLLLLLLW